ncbi:MAG TPA: class II glutamine amidotransferase [Thermoanaerobaculia bacterium]|jgi:predicted glutamine amidotransferase
MCRFALYVGPPVTVDSLTTRPDHSILKQSLHAEEREDPTNGDGFGVGWYVPEIGPEPALYLSPVPAWNDPNLLHISRVSKSPCILAHVRAASPGTAVSVSNCHPFASGPFAFMHNGGIGGFSRIRRRLEEGLSEDAFAGIQGTTDSELAFALFLDAYANVKAEDATERMVGALTEAVAKIEWTADDEGVTEPSYLNFAVTDGRRAVVMRYATPPLVPASLWGCHGRRFSCEGGVCRMSDPGKEGAATLVCSEPLSADGDWQKIPAQNMVVIRGGGNAELLPIPFNDLTRSVAG